MGGEFSVSGVRGAASLAWFGGLLSIFEREFSRTIVASVDATRVGTIAALASTGKKVPEVHKAGELAREMAWEEVFRDVEKVGVNADLGASSLWTNTNPLAALSERSTVVMKDSPGGDFWIDWYQRALDGRPQNWPLLRDVALIDNALWEDSGEALDREIRRLVEQYRLLAEVRRLKAALEAAQAAGIAHRGHNNPPELIDMVSVEVVSAMSEIAEQLDKAEQELQEQTLSPSRLRQIGEKLINVVTAALRYCVDRVDDAIKEAAKKAGGVAGLAGAAYLAGFGDDLTALGKALISFAKGFL